MFEKKSVPYLFFIAIFILFLILIVKLLKPFALIIFFACVFYVVLNPLYIKMLSLLPKKSGKMFAINKIVFALLFSILSLIIFLIPTTFLVYVIVTQLIDLINIAITFFKTFDAKILVDNKIVTLIDELLKELDLRGNIIPTIQNALLSQMSTFSGYLTQNIANIVKGTGTFVTSFIFMMFTLFFLFIDGKYLLNQLALTIPIERKYTNILFAQTAHCIKGIIYGNLLTGLIQAIVGFIIFSIFKVPNSLMFASLIIIASFIPMIGTSIVWLPLGIIIILQESILKGILFIAISASTISLSDNFTRPLLLGSNINLHPLFIFFAILGGILTFGISGIILGPLCFVLFFEIVKIFNEMNKSTKPRKSKKYNRYLM